MAEITLVKAEFGITNIVHEQVMRAQLMSIDNQDIDKLIEDKYSGRVNPVTLNEVSSRSGGLSVVPEGDAYIEDGWGNSRGLGKLTFEITSGPTEQQTLIVLGYLAGGGVSHDGGIPPDTMFVPVRKWLVDQRSIMDANAFLKVNTKVSESGQYLINDPTVGESQTIRPIDIIENSAGLAIDDDNELGGGVGSTYSGSATAVLRLSGVTLSKCQNQSTTEYARKLIEASVRSFDSIENQSDRYSALSESLTTPGINELNVSSDPFMKMMKVTLGMTSMAQFQGFTMDEICHVFENLPDVMFTDAADAARFTVEDHRLDTNEFGTSNLCEIIASKLSYMSQWLLIDNELSVLDISGTNDVNDGEREVNGLPVGYMVGEALPLADGLNIDLAHSVERIKDQLSAYFFSEYCSPYFHARQLVSFRMSIKLFGESYVRVFINGDEGTTRELVFATYGVNRTDPTLTNRESAMEASTNFYQNLKNNFNF